MKILNETWLSATRLSNWKNHPNGEYQRAYERFRENANAFVNFCDELKCFDSILLFLNDEGNFESIAGPLSVWGFAGDLAIQLSWNQGASISNQKYSVFRPQRDFGPFEIE